ncbi:MAG: tetratricopeptide repeat protein [Planctomycetota bacterium]|nr:MAG: tetratricopeptide repeat protein [Planctomycetota bacterium]
MTISFPVREWGRTLCVLLAAGVLVPVSGASADEFSRARQLLLEGKHAEAQEAYRALVGDDAVAAALGVARCQEATGNREAAAETLTQATGEHGDSAALWAELARLALERGDAQSAAAHSQAALKLDAECVLAHYVTAELHASAGRLDEAEKEYEWLVHFYNDNDTSDVDALRWIGRGAAQFARWKRLSDQFGFLVNDFYPDLLSAEPGYWPAHYETGCLFAEKYNDAEAQRAFQAALKLNPNAAEVHAAAGRLALDSFELAAAQNACEQARAINPELLDAALLQADIHLANFDPRQAAGVLRDALKLNPTSEATLGRLAAAYLATDGVTSTGPDSRFGKLEAEVTARNPHAGTFYLVLADALDRLRRWPTSSEYYRQAMTRMPRLIEPPGKLGMMLMRLGEEEEARRLLDASFEADPFNVRVNNTLKVLEVLEGYETLETEHFRIRYDPQKDKLLARYMGRWLEEVYPQLVEQMGFAPPEKSLFEVFSKARNTDGHGWFSARMVGLPRVHTIGACAGKIVALQSPTDAERKFHWARVLKHEFIHVVNLQQTNFNIPHWFTEALAVLNEGYPRPEDWNALLAKSAAEDKLFDLDSINFGFIRPHSSDEWTLAYCQAEIYAEYMLERFGPDAVAKMLSAYGDNLTTPEALQRSFGVSQQDFEQGYTAYLQKILDALPATEQDTDNSLATLTKKLEADPENPALLAGVAQAQLNRKNYAMARKHADAALKIDPANQLAHYVRARLHLLVGESREALERLEQHLDRDNPQENLLALAAGLKLRSEDYVSAAELYELGAAHNPGSTKWLKSLAAVYLKAKNDEKLAPVLEKLAAADSDDLPVRKKLAQLAVAAEDWQAAGKWTLDAMHIDVMDPDLHRWRGQALLASGDAVGAADEFGVAVELAPEADELRLKHAEALKQAGRSEDAKAALEELLTRQPDYDAARKLLESLD